MRQRLKRFLRNTAGVAAVEFAFIGPVLITMYFGVVELTQAMLAQRRAAHVASTLGDLVAQGTSIQAANFTDLWTVGRAIVAPFPTTSLKMQINGIVADASGKTTVAWSEASGMSPLAKNSAVTVPTSVIAPSKGVIQAVVQYSYTSPVSYLLRTPVPLNTTYYLRPRLSDTVTCSDC